MGVSYNRLWKMLIDKNMKRVEMQYLAGISGNILARMGKNKYVSMETVEKICKKMDCTIDEMMEFTDDENSTPDTAYACIVRPAVLFSDLRNLNPGM